MASHVRHADTSILASRFLSPEALKGSLSPRESVTATHKSVDGDMTGRNRGRAPEGPMKEGPGGG